MKTIKIYGGHRLHGELTVSGSKNACLPALAATILAPGISRLESVPDLADVHTMIELLSSLGCKIRREGNAVIVDAHNITSTETPYNLVRRMRASVLIMGALLSRTGHAKVAMPGGCAIGTRPIDLHLKGFKALGVNITENYGCIEGKISGKLRGATVYLDFPSVGATENLMMLAATTSGVTIIENAAREPEIIDLANMINSMGAHINGAGTPTIRITGVQKLHPTNHRIIPDRIEAGTYMVASAITQGNIVIKNVLPHHLCPVMAKLRETGVRINDYGEALQVIGPSEIISTDINTLPYPGFPTDMQAQMMALMTLGKGVSVVSETVFENRFMHVNELCRMGAKIRTDGNKAVVKGVKKLYGVKVQSSDLRAGAALVLAGLVAEGTTQVSGVNHIDRGYEHFESKLRNVGANITRTGAVKKQVIGE
ncbi:UDP-N-acetylglucosamine 1-carboxyvinyltransferase [Clostridium sp. 'deep sea']|uniref:UDP-N-acetylglucosamine 1-carboxyvinyltransferase n=1 Tax=Clostridium sp. 'deep sea' TaxID=2779445 RepID=UPI0018966A81|nr:UDP-N-acetylglucosamine 1-carboxyvinyltransferase [Clostridium sp. 'deep sea']QOR33774.1 UDP-N-acetylglucosamine 1-carboxyvinyltransferase [Clostridium sp. 'deep sea']